MSSRSEGPPANVEGNDRERLKHDWERRCQDALLVCQKSIAELHGEKIPKPQRSIKAAEYIKTFLYVLYSAPIEYRGLILELEFSADDIKEWEAANIIEEQCGVQPEQSTAGAKRYHFGLVAPRFIDWSQSGFSEFEIGHRGSPVRDYRAQHPDLNTMRYELGWSDSNTQQQGMLRIAPHAEVGSFGSTFLVFPRNITRIELTEELPAYLDADEKEGVQDWYAREGEVKK